VFEHNTSRRRSRIATTVSQGPCNRFCEMWSKVCNLSEVCNCNADTGHRCCQHQSEAVWGHHWKRLNPRRSASCDLVFMYATHTHTYTHVRSENGEVCVGSCSYTSNVADLNNSEEVAMAFRESV
jgi:hypothetical protein